MTSKQPYPEEFKIEAVKQITGAGQVLRGEMLIYDALWGETRKIALKPRADCPVCGG